MIGVRVAALMLAWHVVFFGLRSLDAYTKSRRAP